MAPAGPVVRSPVRGPPPARPFDLAGPPATGPILRPRRPAGPGVAARSPAPTPHAETARYLVDAGARLVGIDYLSIEAFDAREPVVHRTLLERDVVILEGLDLRDVAPGRYELVCLPLRLAGLDGSPVRALLRTMDDAPTP
jgi:hypothetical protein